MSSLSQYPETGRHLLRYCGDSIEIRLRSDTAIKGRAILSTNIGNGAVRRDEIISNVEALLPVSGQDWVNLPMEKIDDFTYSLTLSLTEEGHFEFKTCIMEENSTIPIWTPGDNTHLNVEPAAYCCSNTIYCAFVRQFGKNKDKASSGPADGPAPEGSIKCLDEHDYAVIPPSGTFRGLKAELDHIINDLKCRIIHLLPINPTPTVYGRMGRYGSPYASLDFTSVDPALAEFDKKATPLDQFIELTDAVHGKNAKLFIDIAINHTGWAAKLQEEHPEWFVREKDGSIHSPGAWGVVWGDLAELDHTCLDLWKYLANVFITWCSRGVDGFRCDAGYMIPVKAWEYIIAKVREEYPETVFLLEGLGGSPAVTSELLDTANMDWAYSELFQNYSRQQVEGYLNYAWRQSSDDGLMVHYAETHDNSRLAAVSKTYAKMRTALSALASTSGAFGFANGVEWFAKEKIDVHEASALNWGAKENQIDLIARLNTILAVHPAFHDGAMMHFKDSSSPDAVVFRRADQNDKNVLLVAINLNCEKSTVAEWETPHNLNTSNGFYDLITGRRYEVVFSNGHKQTLSLKAGEFVCMTSDKKMLQAVDEAQKKNELIPERIVMQEAAAMALRYLKFRKKSSIVKPGETLKYAMMLRKSPEELVTMMLDHVAPCPCMEWKWPEDVRREVMLPVGTALLVTAPCRFRFTISSRERSVIRVNSIPTLDGKMQFALITIPLKTPSRHRRLDAEICTSENGVTRRQKAHLFLLASDVEKAKVSFPRIEIYKKARTFLQANGRGAITHQQMELGRLASRYDAILLANLNKNHPEDRHVMWRRIQLKISYHARLQELEHQYITSFHVADDGGGLWNYKVPVGNGLFIDLIIKMEIVKDKNAVIVTVVRPSSQGAKSMLPDDERVEVLVRPDIEDRNFHCATKASAGPENYWPGRISASAKGFEFRPSPDRRLSIGCSSGRFVSSPKWSYMNYQENEASRGLDPNSDLYSPGIFRIDMAGGDAVYVCGQIRTSSDEEIVWPKNAKEQSFNEADDDFRSMLIRSMGEFIVKRDNLKTVIAGYPWFLDWGRDTLIAARGYIAAPEYRNDVKAILLQFAKFAENGTIPNMISGDNADNRDTSDAPLWLFTAVSDLCKEEKSFDFLNTKVKGSLTLLDTLVSIVDGIMKGTPNGIEADKESCLVYSPAHFTWMDTNYPAGTPRKGYPVEIQSLWFAALDFLFRATEDKKYQTLRDKVRESFNKYFILPDGSVSDCLHTMSNVPASKAVADDHNRPNQLLAVTLGLVTDKDLIGRIIADTSRLLIPGAIRSLADEKVNYLLPITGKNGHALNDPSSPYWGKYEGDEDTRRKPAYHNGTAWTWLFPSFPEACLIFAGAEGRAVATSILSSMSLLMDGGCIAQLPEILDGDYPHTPRGCDAQAWGITEYYRVWTLLHPNAKKNA